MAVAVRPVLAISVSCLRPHYIGFRGYSYGSLTGSHFYPNFYPQFTHIHRMTTLSMLWRCKSNLVDATISSSIQKLETLPFLWPQFWNRPVAKSNCSIPCLQNGDKEDSRRTR